MLFLHYLQNTFDWWNVDGMKLVFNFIYMYLYTHICIGMYFSLCVGKRETEYMCVWIHMPQANLQYMKRTRLECFFGAGWSGDTGKPSDNQTLVSCTIIVHCVGPGAGVTGCWGMLLRENRLAILWCGWVPSQRGPSVYQCGRMRAVRSGKDCVPYLEKWKKLKKGVTLVTR